jgi:hypothetical protein
MVNTSWLGSNEEEVAALGSQFLDGVAAPEGDEPAEPAGVPGHGQSYRRSQPVEEGKQQQPVPMRREARREDVPTLYQLESGGPATVGPS